MKCVIKKILMCIMWIACKVYPYSLSERLRGYRDILYTMWVGKFIGHIGKHTLISYPCNIQDGSKKIVIGEGTIIYSNCIIECWERYIDQHFSPSLKIGNNCRIGEYTHITAINRIEIGDGLLTGRFVIITDHSHGDLSEKDLDIPPAIRKLKSKGKIVIGNNVWLGDKVSVLSGVHIGDNVIVGANSVVTKSVPSNCVVAGVPAKIVKQLDS